MRVEVPAEEADVVNDILWQHGPDAVSEEGDQLVVFVAGYPDDVVAAAAHAAVARRWEASLLDDDADWVSTWRADEPAHAVGPFHLRLPEHPPPSNGLDLVIEPGRSFGFSHQSTLLALELLDDLNIAGRSVADIGSGSGVLSVAAAMLGAAGVAAVDIEPEAVAQTGFNVGAHGVSETVSVQLGSVEAIDPPVDVVLANMLAPALEGVAADIVSRFAPETVVLSGFLVDDVDRIAEAFRPMRRHDLRRRGDWAALSLWRPA